MDAVRIRNLSKRYVVYPNPRYLFREIFRPGRDTPFEVRWAIRDANFEVPRGQACAFIGLNGSGKSTLLGLISGIITPSSGEVIRNGRISSMLELGAGFQPELTGRQNISVKGALLGMSKQELQDHLLDEILEFSELGEHVDKPVKTYSTGMMLRLGFSVAVHADFDILLIDEILSVGDLLFKRKCVSKMRAFKEMGKTILLASHSLADVAGLCDRIILLEDGRVAQDGPVESVIRQYWEACEREQNRIGKRYDPFKAVSIYGDDTGEIKITGVRFLNERGEETDTFKTQERMVIRIGYHAQQKVANPLFRVQFFRNDGLWVHGANTYRQDLDLGTLEGTGEIELAYEKLNLLDADYFVSIGIWPDEYRSFITDVAYDLHDLAYVIHVTSDRIHGGGIVYNPFTWKLLRDDGRPPNGMKGP